MVADEQTDLWPQVFYHLFNDCPVRLPLFLIDHGCVTEEVAFRRLLSNICGFTSEPLINPIVSSPRGLIRRKYSGPVPMTPSGLP